MDWSAIYEETGDEDGDWAGFSSRLTPILENFSSRGQYTTLICYVFTINYILGVGCLGIPYAFFKSGIVLGSILIVLLSVVAYMTVMWVAESGYRDLEIRQLEEQMTPMTRTPRIESGRRGRLGSRSRRRSRGRTLSTEEMFTRTSTPDKHSQPVTLTLPLSKLESGDNDIKSAGNSSPASSTTLPAAAAPGHKSVRSYGSMSSPLSQLSPHRDKDKDDPVEFCSLSRLIEQEASQKPPSPTASLYSPPAFPRKHPQSVTSGEYNVLDVDGDGEAEVVELVLRFLGPNAKSCYQVCVMLLMTIGLIAYTQVFVQTFVQQVWPSTPASLPYAMFAVVVVPLSCVDLAEQIHIQVVMAALRFLSLATLVLGALVAVCMDSRDSGYSSWADAEANVPLYDAGGFSLMFTTAIFSQLFQHSVPGLIRPLQPQEKKSVPNIFMYALCTTGFFYLVIGVSSVCYFGPKINQAINLNFVNFVWGLQDMPFAVEAVVRSLSMVVVLFPALDTVSVYPLIANTLGNNFNVSFPNAYKSVHSVLEDYTSVELTRGETKKLTTQGWRLLAAAPPIIWSMFIADLSLTLQFAGLCGILVALITPSLLQYYSIQELEDTIELCYTGKNDDDGTVEERGNPYAGVFSHVYFTYAILVLASFALLVCTYQIYDTT